MTNNQNSEGKRKQRRIHLILLFAVLLLITAVIVLILQMSTPEGIPMAPGPFPSTPIEPSDNPVLMKA